MPLLCVLALLASLALVACGDDEDGSAGATPARFATVTPAQIAPRVERDEVLLVDVRTDDEWAAGRAPKAIHVPLAEVEDRLAELRSQARGRPIAFICRSGRRSAQASRIALDGGLEEVIDVGGGMGAWAKAGLPIRPADDTKAIGATRPALASDGRPGPA